MRRLPGSLAEVRASPRGAQVGAFFDLDGTLVAGMTAATHTKARIRNREIGTTEFLRMLQIALDYRRGRLEFEKLLDEGTAPMKDRNLNDLDDFGELLFQTKIVDLVYPEMRELVRAHQERGHTVVLSSSAMTIQVDPVARYLGVDTVLCNHFEVDPDGVLTGSVEQPVVWAGGKSEAVQLFARDNGVDLAESYFYADGDEDLPLMYVVGNPRPTNPKERMAKVAARRGWPVLALTSRGAGGALGRSALGLAVAVPLGAAGLAKGLATRDKWTGLNVLLSRWPKALLDVNGVKLRVVGEENAVAVRPAVFIFNHRNNFDPFIAAAVVKENFTGVAKKELQKSPIMGPVGKLMDTAFIDRDNPRSAVAALRVVEQNAENGLSILISPEGTRIDTATVGKFKKGAFRMAMKAKIPVVPIVIRNAEYVAGRNSGNLNPGTVDVAVLPPIDVSGWKVRDLSARIEEVRELYIRTLENWPSDG